MTTYTAILSDCERFELTDLIRNGSYVKEISLTIYDKKFPRKEVDFWDNSEYLIKLFKDLKNRVENTDTKGLKEFLKEQNYNYLECKEILLEMYDKAVELGMI